MFVLSFTSAVVDRASFKKTSEMAKVKSFSCQLQISKSTTARNQCNVLCSFISIFVHGAGSLFVSRPFARPEKSSNIFSEAIKDAQTTVLQCHVLIICFHSTNHDADRRPLVDIRDLKQDGTFNRTLWSFFQLLSLSPGNTYQLKELATTSC